MKKNYVLALLGLALLGAQCKKNFALSERHIDKGGSVFLTEHTYRLDIQLSDEYIRHISTDTPLLDQTAVAERVKKARKVMALFKEGANTFEREVDVYQNTLSQNIFSSHSFKLEGTADKVELLKLKVLDAEGNTLFVAPVRGQKLSDWVEPAFSLPIDITLQKDRLAPEEVVAVRVTLAGDGLKIMASDFGYLPAEWGKGARLSQ